MTHLTHSQISAARENDLDAVSAVISETEALIKAKARHYAGSAEVNGNALAEDLAQAGRIAVWQSLAKFDGDSPGEFMKYIDRALHTAMSEARRAETRPGVTPYAAGDFEKALTLAGGDPYDAERIAITDDMGERQMSPDHAYAARLSWLGLEYLDRPVQSEGGKVITLAAKLEREIGMPAELITAADIASHRRTVIRDQVHRTLGLLSERQRHVVKAVFGISPVPKYRPVIDDAELEADTGLSHDQVRQARKKGKERFSELYRAGARAW
ncbi:RNA polymerase sigma factor [Streptomyces sp. NBC_01506]|uniref:RNA polymerase sigma factor n=1 Tax=Streptomyces sp. NBC_01506 TaxID=2903887 RepID=UPI003870E86E